MGICGKAGRYGIERHVSVGGLDSITLLLFLRKIGLDIPAVSVSVLEDMSIQRVHTRLGVIKLKPDKSKVKVLNEVGFPVISKKIAGRIDTLQHPTDKIRQFAMRSLPEKRSARPLRKEQPNETPLRSG